MPPEITSRHLEVEGALHVRAGAERERIIEGRIVPFGVPTLVRDQDAAGNFIGRAYREVITGLADFDPSSIVLENGFGVKGGHRGPIAGRGHDGRLERDGADMAFRALRTTAGNDLYELALEGIPISLSVEIEPSSPSKRRADGTVERTAIVRRVAALERGAYAGAQVTAVRAEPGEGNEMPPDNTGDTQGAQPPEIAQPQAAVPAQLPGSAQPVAMPAAPALVRQEGTDALLQRSAAERDVAAQLGRGPAIVTRDELVYGPTSGRSFLHDLINMHHGNAEAAAAMGRHYAMLESIQDDLVKSRAGFGEFDRIVMARTGVNLGSPVMGRAGDVISSEVPGAYPNTYLPGLLTPRILKGRPMGGFYQRVPINNATPQIFPKVSTSTTVAVQASEGVNPAASDFATTAVTATPLLYGAETVISRQVLDGGSPAAEGMVLDDMIEAYAQASETVIKTAVEAGSTDSGVAITAATPYAGVLANVINHYGVRFKGAEGVFGPSAGFSTLLAESDTTGRPKLPWTGPVNSDGTVEAGGGAGNLLGARVSLAYAATANVWVFGRPTDFVIFESPIARFSYDAVTGPAGVRVGIWAYLVVGARLGSLKRTAA